MLINSSRGAPSKAGYKYSAYIADLHNHIVSTNDSLATNNPERFTLGFDNLSEVQGITMFLYTSTCCC